ncbi:MAG: hypothetical protein JWO35_888 [Candidatus Saccharibacteria bacterium]|nr:hypothetical protein [Candidatus Saccharibacteria bacterium]
MSPFGARLQKLLTRCSYALAALLPFLVPFDANRNIDMQGLILLIAGGFSWSALALRYRRTLQQLSPASWALIAVYVASCLISLAATHAGPYAIAGSPYIRLGSLGLIACIGGGLLLQRFDTRTLIKYLYASISLVALISIPYTLIEFHSVVRISGLVAQADVFGVLLGCGFLLGLALINDASKWRNYLLANQCLLVVLLLLTGTRAAILLTIALAVCWQLQNQRSRFLKFVPIYVILIVVLVGSVHYIQPNRLTNVAYASESVSYRRDLQSAALRSSLDKPLLGYGAGNLADALDCTKLSEKSLQTTCHDGYFFNSSHNIFIDRMLGVGWLGGLAYLSIIIFAIYQGLRAKNQAHIFGYLALLISLYYLTNVTSVVLELLLWVTLLQCLKKPPTKT